MKTRPPRTRTLPVKFSHMLGDCPNFHKSGSIAGMRRQFYGQDAQLVRCGSYIYNVTSSPRMGEILRNCKCFAC